MNFEWPAPAKINLFLFVIKQRSDGYHQIRTLLHFLDYCDILTIIPNNSGKICLSTSCNIKKEKNLVFRAAKLLKIYASKEKFTKNLGVKIFLKKNLPIGGGLGGASSDAATTLVVLNKQWNCNFHIKKLERIGLKLGSDVPFFIHGISSLAEGRGEKLTPIKLSEKWYFISTPSINISTSFMYKRYSVNRFFLPLHIRNNIYQNDFEPIVKNLFPIVKKYIGILSKYAPTRLTGTGSCTLSEFNSKEEMKKILSIIPRWIKGFIAKGSNVSPLHKNFFK